MTSEFSHGRRVGLAMALARWSIGCLFIYMGVVKGLHPVEFLKLIRQYEMVHSPWVLNSIGAALPWFEVFCGLLFLSGIAVRGTALMSLAMLIPFTIVVWKRALALQTAAGIPFCAVKFDCGCGAGEVWICRKLMENFVLILLCIGLLFIRSNRLCVRHSLLRD